MRFIGSVREISGQPTYVSFHVNITHLVLIDQTHSNVLLLFIIGTNQSTERTECNVLPWDTCNTD